jgi:hypothetical protein
MQANGCAARDLNPEPADYEEGQRHPPTTGEGALVPVRAEERAGRYVLIHHVTLVL